MIDQEEIHNKCLCDDPKERIRAVEQLISNFSLLPHKQQAWDDLVRLTEDDDEDVCEMTVNVLSSAFPYVPNKQQAWNDLYQLTAAGDYYVCEMAAEALGSVFPYVPDKQQAWDDLISLTGVDDIFVKAKAAKALGYSFSFLPDKQQEYSHVLDKQKAWNELHELTSYERDIYVRESAAQAISSGFSSLPDKQQAWDDLIKLANDQDNYVRGSAAKAICYSFSLLPNKQKTWNTLTKLITDEDDYVRCDAVYAVDSAFPYLSEKELAWNYLINLTNDESERVRAYANYSLGKISISKASQAEKEDEYKKELENAINYLETARLESNWENPSPFCLPFYYSLYTILFEEYSTQEELNELLEINRIYVEKSKNKKLFFEVIENLVNALNKVHNFEKMDYDTKEYEPCYKKCFERVASLLDNPNISGSSTTKIIKKGIPILERKLKTILTENIGIEGPFISGSSEEDYVIYMLREQYHWQEFTVGIITSNDSTHIRLLTKNIKDLFRLTIDCAAENLENWKEIPCYIAIMQGDILSGYKDQELDIRIHDTKERDLKKIALEIMSALTVKYQSDSEDEKYVVTKEMSVTESGLRNYYIRKKGSEIGRSVIVREDPNLDLSLLGHIESKVNKIDADMYYTEAINYTLANNVKLAFRSFYYFIQTVPKDSSEDLDRIVELGLGLSNKMLMSQPDLTEWTASIVARYAEDLNRYDDAAEAQRLAGIASQSLGRICECIEHYEAAINLFDKIVSERIKAKIHMSYGISMISLLMHCEAENILPIHSDNLTKLLQLAKTHLKCAREILSRFDDESAHHSLCAVDLDLIRVDDLYGNHYSALEKLNVLEMNDTSLLNDPKLGFTAVLYNLLITKKLADNSERWIQNYYSIIEQLSELFTLNEVASPYHCVFYTLRGDIFLKLGRYEEAIQDISHAYKIQLEICGEEIRPPTPEREYGTYGGIKNIDLCGRIQHALILMGNSSNDNNVENLCLLNALCLADNSKGRFFKRDLSYLLTKSPTELSPLLARGGKSLLESMVKGLIDQRILKADYEWYLERDLPPEKAQSLLQDAIDTNINPGSLREILSKSKDKVVFLSLYSTSENTIIYLMNDLSKPPVIKILDLSLDQLESIINAFRRGMDGSKRSGCIDPKNPNLKHKFFEPFLNMMGAFDSLLPKMESSDLILISPHGLWHELPLHAYILPKLWENDLSPGLLYTPSIGLFDLLNIRDAEDSKTHRKKIGLSVVPASEDSENIDLFLKSYDQYLETFKKTGINVIAHFGKEVTADRLFEDMENVGLQHIISHGTFENDKPMESKLLVSDGERLPSKKSQENNKEGHGTYINGIMIMANKTTASTAVIQACNLGKARAVYGEEFWGIIRAMISAGTNCVISPIWNVDLESSTALLIEFYENWMIKKEPKYKAWTNAQRSILQKKGKPEWRHFYHWASFRMIGC